MTYNAPELLLVGAAQGMVLSTVSIDFPGTSCLKYEDNQIGPPFVSRDDPDF